MGIWNAVTRRKRGPKDRVVAHILDPISGHLNRDLCVGKDIDAETVRRLGDSGEIFVIVDYEGGVPTATVCKQAQWLRAQAEQDGKDQPVDTSVWRQREELEIG